jgi:hypothetical protein
MTFTAQKNTVVRSDAQWLEKANKWREAKCELEKWKEIEDTLRQELILLAGDNGTAGGGIQLSKSMRKGLVDYEKIPELKGVDLEQYRKPSAIAWRILLLDKL